MGRSMDKWREKNGFYCIQIYFEWTYVNCLIKVFHGIFYSDRQQMQHSCCHSHPQIYFSGFLPSLVPTKTSKIYMVKILQMNLECLKRSFNEFRREAVSRSSVPQMDATHTRSYSCCHVQFYLSIWACTII